MSEKRGVRFNIIDFLIIVAVLASLFVIIFRGTIIDFIGKVIYTEEATVTVKIQNLDAEQIDMINTDDTLYWNGELFGTVEDVKFTNSRTVTLNDGGDYPIFVDTIDSEHFEVDCTVKVRGAFFDDGFHLSGSYYLGVGKVLELYSDSFYCSAIITSIA